MEWHNPNFVISKLPPQEYIVDPRYKGQIQTCRLQAIGKFDPGPDRAKKEKKQKKTKKNKKKQTSVLTYSQIMAVVFFFLYSWNATGPPWPLAPVERADC